MPYCEYCGLSQQESDNLPCEYSRTNKHSFKSILRSSGKESGEKQIDLGNFKKQSVLIEKQSQAQQLDSMKLASEMLQKQETEITKEKEKEKTKQEEPWINIQVQYNPNVDSFGLRFNCLVCEFLLEFNALVTAHFANKLLEVVEKPICPKCVSIFQKYESILKKGQGGDST